MSSNKITLNPSTRRANREAFVKANPWTPGLTLGVIHEKVTSGQETLKGGFAFPEVTVKSTKRHTARKGATPTRKANTKASKGKSKPKPKPESEFHKWLVATAEQRDVRKKGNKAQAEWMREHGILPTGQAWVACSKGERSVSKLLTLNAQDGLKGVAQKSSQPVKASKTTKVTAVAAVVEPSQTAKPHRPNGSFMTKAQAEQFHKLLAGGLPTEDARKAAVVLA